MANICDLSHFFSAVNVLYPFGIKSRHRANYGRTWHPLFIWLPGTTQALLMAIKIINFILASRKQRAYIKHRCYRIY